VATSRIYKISRHPQYLGWILWSYGFILFAPFEKTMKMSWTVPSSLPWLLMTMTIVGICMIEEIKMMKITGGSYANYRESSPFLLPLPSWLHRILTWPGRLVTHGEYPSGRKQVLWIVLIYTVILMALSLIWMDLGDSRMKNESAEEAKQELTEILNKLEKVGNNRQKIYALINQIPGHGKAGKESLVSLAGNPNPVIREFSIMQLGRMEAREAEDVIIRSMYDSIKRVRSSAIIAAGEIKSENVSDSLIAMLINPRLENNIFHIYGALSAIGDPDAIPFLAEGLDKQEWYKQNAALGAIMEIDPQRGIDYAMEELKDEEVHIRRNAVTLCILSDDPRVVAPLRELFNDDDFEVRFYARQGVRRIQSRE